MGYFFYVFAIGSTGFNYGTMKLGSHAYQVYLPVCVKMTSGRYFKHFVYRQI